MYVPAAFAVPEADVEALLAEHGAADLVTPTADGLMATFLPFLHEGTSLLGHVARNNPHWSTPATGSSLVIVRGPDAYITPTWYASKAEHGRVVPTWNYVTVHVHGRLVVHDDVDWLRDLVTRLTVKHEAGSPTPWQVSDAPEKFVAGQLRAIVGLELVIERVEAKAKLSQNRPAADVEGVVRGLTERGDEASAAAVTRAAVTRAASQA
jgi:transcriptional regulator